MPAPFFTTNDSEISRLEGLYIKERNPPAQIAGAFLGVVAVVGETVRGPVDKPILISNESRFERVFGGRDQGGGGAIVNKIWQALLNKPFGELIVIRAADADAVVATHNASDANPTAIIQIDASSPGAWGNNVTYDVVDATDGNSNHYNLVFHYLGNTVTYQNVNTTTGNDNTLALIGTDDANLVVVTKLASGRPVNATGVALTTGSDGTIADADFTASGRALPRAAAYPGVGVVFIAERSSAALRAAVTTLASAASDRLFILNPDDQTVSSSSAITDVASYRAQRNVYTYNHAYTVDPQTATEVLTSPNAWMASILSQIDVDIHPGEEDTKAFTAGITRLYDTTLARGDYIALHDAGICAFESDDGFAFVSGVLTDLTPGKTEITRRRSTDYLQLSVASTLKHSVKKKNTESRRIANTSMINSFLRGLQKAERIVENFVVDGNVLNNDTDRAQGIERILMRVKLLGHMLHLVLETEIGTGVTIVTEQ
jgi:hypothetical protein